MQTTMKTFFLVCLGFFSALLLNAQTYDAAPTAHITLNNGQSVDTLLEAGSVFSGKAPLEVELSAGVTIENDRLHYDWEFADNAEFTSPDRAYDDSFSRRIEWMGTYYIRLTITDLDTDSATVYPEFQISLSESRLSVPNTFTPNGDGVHDVLKVSYESLVSFQAAVFNRWGKKVYSWDNPDEGWDGGGCSTGVYFIVVKAQGGDGQEYEVKQAVNLLR